MTSKITMTNSVLDKRLLQQFNYELVGVVSPYATKQGDLTFRAI